MVKNSGAPGRSQWQRGVQRRIADRRRDYSRKHETKAATSHVWLSILGGSRLSRLLAGLLVAWAEAGSCRRPLIRFPGATLLFEAAAAYPQSMLRQPRTCSRMRNSHSVARMGAYAYRRNGTRWRTSSRSGYPTECPLDARKLYCQRNTALRMCRMSPRKKSICLLWRTGTEFVDRIWYLKWHVHIIK